MRALSVDALRRLRTWPLESTWNGAYAMPRKPGPSLAPPIDTNGGISQLRRLRRQLVGHDRAVARVHHVGVRHEARVQVIRAAGVIGLAGAHRADDRQVVHLLGDLRQVLVDLPVARGADRLELARRSWRRASCPTCRSSAARRPSTAGCTTCGSASSCRRVGPQRVPQRQRRPGQRRTPGQVLEKMPTSHPAGSAEIHRHALDAKNCTRYAIADERGSASIQRFGSIRANPPIRVHPRPILRSASMHQDKLLAVQHRPPHVLQRLDHVRRRGPRAARCRRASRPCPAAGPAPPGTGS